MITNTPFTTRSIGDYVTAVAGKEPAPGGGSVAGLVGALGAALGEMVVSLTKEPPAELTAANDRLSGLRARAFTLGEADEQSYAGYLRASRLPKTTDDEKAHRKAVMATAMDQAVAVPMQLAETCLDVLTELREVVRSGNKNILGDAESAITLARACIEICLINIRNNLPFIKDPNAATALTTRLGELEAQLADRHQTLTAAVDARYGRSSANQEKERTSMDTEMT